MMISLRGLRKTYRLGGAEVGALRGVDLDIAAGEFVAIMGPSGSGKSTLMHMLGLLDAPDAGSYSLDGREVAGLSEDELAAVRSRSIGFVFQQFNLLARTSARENVQLPLLYAGPGPAGGDADTLLAEVGLGQRGDHKPNELSGGQQQRVAIARALINRPRIVLADEPTGNLDSTSSVEIMRIFERLNRRGITMVLVTHEPDIARWASRVVTMKDGRILSDRRQGARPRWRGTPKAAEIPAPKGLRVVFREYRSHSIQAVRALLANKVRTILSTLGITIGVMAVIAMLAIGAGAQKSIKSQLSQLGSNLLNIRPGAVRSGGVSLGPGLVSRLSDEDAAAVAALPDVTRVSAEVNGSVQAVANGNNWSTLARGASPTYREMRAVEPVIGRFFTEAENRSRARVAVLGLTVVGHLFGGRNPVGGYVMLNRVIFQVVGVLPAKGSNGFQDQDDTILVPVQTAMHRLFGKDYFDSVDVEVASSDRMTAVQDSIGDLLRRRHRIAPSQDDDFQVQNMADIQAAISGTTRTLSALLAFIAAISLLVGGIGIMNIMLVSVTERTREIGLRKALGARRGDILSQFIIEAIVVSLLGGLAGLILGSLISWAISLVAGWATEISAASVLLAILFSSGIGMVFGFWPARKAAALNPIVALRFE